MTNDLLHQGTTTFIPWAGNLKSNQAQLQNIKTLYFKHFI